MNFKHLLASGALGLALAAGCRDASTETVADRSDPQVVIARWKNGEIRRGAIQNALARRLAAVPQPVSPEAKTAIVRQVIERRVRTAMLFAEAKAQGVPERPEVKIRQAAAAERVLAEDLLGSDTASAKATDAQVAAEVDRRLAAVHPEEARKFSHIFLRAPEAAPAARAQAQAEMASIQKELAGGTGFNKLAEKHSTSVTARGGGKIEWTQRRSLPPALAEIVFGLKEGEVSDIVTSRDGLHLFRLDGIRAGSPINVEAIRSGVRQELDSEARQAEVRARRQQALDAAGVEFDSPARLARLESAGQELPGSDRIARWQGGGVTAEEMVALRGWVARSSLPVEAELRLVAENRLLAATRRAQALSPKVEAAVAEARDLAVIDSYRQSLIEGLATEPTEEEIAAYHRDHAESALFLRDFEGDVLFFPQTGDSIAEVYAAGEEVGTKLRDGAPFDDLLDHPARAQAKTCRAAHGIDLEAIGRTSVRLRKAILNLAPGEISSALYLDGPTTEVVPGKCVLAGAGVAFVRLRSLGTLPLADSRASIRAALQQEKQGAGVTAIQQRLLAQSGLEILVPEG